MSLPTHLKSTGRWLGLTTLMLLLGSVPAGAQENTGMISGTVVDDQGQVLPVPAKPGEPVGPQNYGTTPRRVSPAAGVNNMNLHLFKNFRLGGDRVLQFRWEMYNVLNHTQFSNVNLLASFDADGNLDNRDP